MARLALPFVALVVGAPFLMSSLASCAAPCETPLSAMVLVEETGEVLPVLDVLGARAISGDRMFVRIRLAGGDSLDVDFVAPPPRDELLSFVGEGAELPRARVDFVRDRVIVCSGTAEVPEGGLVVRRVAWDDAGFPTCLDATLRARFVGCDELFGGGALSEQTFRVELPAE